MICLTVNQRLEIGLGFFFTVCGQHHDFTVCATPRGAKTSEHSMLRVVRVCVEKSGIKLVPDTLVGKLAVTELADVGAVMTLDILWN